MNVQLFTIGFSGKSAPKFFELLQKARIERLVDIRRSNNTLYAGFTRARDLPYLLQQLGGIDYVHEPEFAPSLDLLRWYQKRLKKNKKDAQLWPEYVQRFTAEIAERPVLELFRKHTAGLSRVCFLCMEPTAEHCHRRLLAEHIRDGSPARKVEIVHL